MCKKPRDIMFHTFIKNGYLLIYTFFYPFVVMANIKYCKDNAVF